MYDGLCCSRDLKESAFITRTSDYVAEMYLVSYQYILPLVMLSNIHNLKTLKTTVI